MYPFLLVFLLFVWGFAFGQDVATHQVLKVNPSADSFEVVLPANPTTGFQWVLKSYDNKRLTFVSTHYRATASQPIGGGGETQFLFHWKHKKEKTTLVFWYIRPWEKKPVNIKKVVVTHCVKFTSP